MVTLLRTLVHVLHGSNQLGGSALSAFHDLPQYDVYECADGGHVTIGALEPQFDAQMLGNLGLDDVDLQARLDSEQ